MSLHDWPCLSFKNVGQYFYTSVSAIIQIYQCPIGLFRYRIYRLEIMSATFFLSSSFLPVSCSPFTFVFWNQIDKFFSSSHFALAFRDLGSLKYFPGHSAISPRNGSGNRVEFKGITNYKWESNHTRDYMSVSLPCFKKTVELFFEMK